MPGYYYKVRGETMAEFASGRTASVKILISIDLEAGPCPGDKALLVKQFGANRVVNPATACFAPQ